MTNPTAPRTDTLPAPVMGRPGRIAVALLIWLGIGALAGGVALIAGPDGSIMHMPLSWLAGSPFPDFLVPGLILGGLFGVGSFAVAGLGLRGRRAAPFLAFALGCAQMIWIVVELAIIRGISVLHPLYFLTGLGIAAAAALWGWPTFQGWRSSRR
jgi:hypothetical protein